jgi:hypothetical protein
MPSVCSPPPLLAVYMSFCLSRLCSAGISGSVRSCGGGLALTSPPFPLPRLCHPHLSRAPSQAPPTLPLPPKFLGSQIRENTGSQSSSSSLNKSSLFQSPPPLPTHAQFKNTKPGLVALSAASLSAQPLPSPLPAHSFFLYPHTKYPPTPRLLLDNLIPVSPGPHHPPA